MNNEITCLCLIPLSHFSTSLLAVGMRGGTIQLYQGRHLVDVIMGGETPSAIAFGQLGQEEHVMVIVTTGKYRLDSDLATLLKFPSSVEESTKGKSG